MLEEFSSNDLGIPFALFEASWKDMSTRVGAVAPSVTKRAFTFSSLVSAIASSRIAPSVTVNARSMLAAGLVECARRAKAVWSFRTQSFVSSLHTDRGLVVAVGPNYGVDRVERRRWNASAPAAKR